MSPADTRVTALVTCMTDPERPYIEAALASILRQTVPCRVVVLLNERSALFDDLDARFPGVRFVRTALRPLGSMRNFGLQFVDTPWVAYLDGDDLWHPAKTERQLEALARTGADLAGCDYSLVDELGAPFAIAFSGYIPVPSSWLVKTEVMVRCPFDDDKTISEDGRWWTAHARADGSVRALRLPEVLVDYRVRGLSLSEGSAPGRRKRRLKRLALLAPPLRWGVLATTELARRCNRREVYRASGTG